MARFSRTILLLAVMTLLATTALAQNFGDSNLEILAENLKRIKNWSLP